MQSINIRFMVFLMVGASFLLAGCESAPKKKEPSDEKVSTLPWNKPEKWEKSMPIGGASY